MVTEGTLVREAEGSNHSTENSMDRCTHSLAA